MPFNIVCPDLFTTAKCNLRCKYCFEYKDAKSLKFKDFKEYAENNSYLKFFMFGGEPLLELDLIIDIIRHTPKKRRKELRKIITNGTLIPKYIEKIKKHNLEMQISIDGPKFINDENRVYANGKGSFDKIIEGIECCIKNDVRWSLHGVCNKKTLPHFAEQLKWFFDTYRKYKSCDWAIDRMGKNVVQIIFEEDYTDENVDTLIRQVYEIAKWIENSNLTKEQKQQLGYNIFEHKGGSCGAGTSLLALDTDLDIYPCHRLATVPEKEEYLLGNVYKPEKFKNFKLYNIFFRAKQRGLYSAVKNIQPNYNKDNTLRWFNWCPATNLQTSGTPFYQSAKYNVMIKEVNSAIKDVIEKYDYRTRKRNNSK